MSISDKLTVIAGNEQKVFDAGRNSFMEDYQTFGSAHLMFSGPSWNDKTFYPVKDINLHMTTFEYFSWQMKPYIDMYERLEECGVKILPFPKNASITNLFAYCFVSRLPELDFSSKANENLDRVFRGCSTLITIDKLILGERTGEHGNTFQNCSALENLVIDGTLSKSISFAASPLTLESMRNVIYSLNNLSDTSETATLTLKATAAANLTYEDRQNITDKGWTLSEI